jgi:hypothetical protein
VIRYSLVCHAGHGFESWFRSSADYDVQHKRKLVACPVCDSSRVEKQIMAPRLGRSHKSSRPNPPAGEKTTVAMMSPEETEFRQKLKELRDHVTKNADYVGEQFPDLARKMHHEEVEKRSIYGEAKPDEVRELLDEGVELAPLPVLPEEKN